MFAALLVALERSRPARPVLLHADIDEAVRGQRGVLRRSAVGVSEPVRVGIDCKLAASAEVEFENSIYTRFASAMVNRTRRRSRPLTGGARHAAAPFAHTHPLRVRAVVLNEMHAAAIPLGNTAASIGGCHPILAMTSIACCRSASA